MREIRKRVNKNVGNEWKRNNWENTPEVWKAPYKCVFNMLCGGACSCNRTTFPSKPETGMTMETCKATAIQTDLGRFAHILVYSGVFRTLVNLV